MESWGGSTLMSKEKTSRAFRKTPSSFEENIKEKHTEGIRYSKDGHITKKKSRCKLHLPFVAGPGIEPGTS